MTDADSQSNEENSCQDHQSPDESFVYFLTELLYLRQHESVPSTHSQHMQQLSVVAGLTPEQTCTQGLDLSQTDQYFGFPRPFNPVLPDKYPAHDNAQHLECQGW